MTIKQAFIGIVTAIALVIAVLISQIVRINTMTGDLQEAQTRIEALETKAAATPKPTATPEPSTEPTATPEPVVYVVSPVSEFNAYNVEAAPYYWLPVPDAEADGTLEAGTNMVVSGVCGELYYAMLPDGTYFYIPQSAVAQVPEATTEPTPEPTPEPAPESVAETATPAPAE